MLTKELEMLQPDAFCEHEMQQNMTVTGAHCAPDTTREVYSAHLNSLANFKGVPSQQREGGEGGKGRGNVGKELEGLSLIHI